MEIQVRRLHVALLFAILFVSVGWIAPAAYASYAPEDQFIEVHSFEAEDTDTSASEHTICFDRTVHESHSGTIYTELYLVSDSNASIEVDARTMNSYFEAGRHIVSTEFSLPNDLQAGEYKYLLVVEMELANGRVQREFSYTSETFTITNNTTTGNYTCT